MKRKILILVSLLLAFLIASLAYAQKTDSRRPLRQFDGVRYTSGENGKWVKGCSTGQACNMGVGNLGPAGTYHWE
jgi:hypothetical protein